MKRILLQALAVFGVATSAVVFTPACADNDQTVFIESVLFPSTNRVNGKCIYTNDESQPRLFEGRLDVGIRDSYTAVLLVGSQLAPRGDTANARTESNRTHLNGAIVTVTDPNGGEIGSFTSVGSGFVDVAQQNAAGFGTIQVTLIDQPTQAKIGLTEVGQTKLVIANIKVFGTTLGGTDVESSETAFPIRLCNGCLVSFSAGDDPAKTGLDCNLPLEGTTTTNLPCEGGQDEATPCQLCPTRKVCQGI